MKTFLNFSLKIHIKLKHGGQAQKCFQNNDSVNSPGNSYTLVIIYRNIFYIVTALLATPDTMVAKSSCSKSSCWKREILKNSHCSVFSIFWVFIAYIAWFLFHATRGNASPRPCKERFW